MKKTHLYAYKSCLQYSMLHHYLGHTSVCEDQDQDRRLFLTLWGTMLLIKNKRLVEEGNSWDNIVENPIYQNSISKNRTKTETQYLLQILKNWIKNIFKKPVTVTFTLTTVTSKAITGKSYNNGHTSPVLEGGVGWPMRGRDLVMWSEGQRETSRSWWL